MSLFVSIGGHCYVSWTLREAGLQSRSLPLDWVNSFDFAAATTLLRDHEAAWVDGLVRSPLAVDANFDHVLWHEELKLRLPHELKAGAGFDRQAVRDRYRRRVERFWRSAAHADRVVFVREHEAVRYGIASPCLTSELVDTFLSSLGADIAARATFLVGGQENLCHERVRLISGPGLPSHFTPVHDRHAVRSRGEELARLAASSAVI